MNLLLIAERSKTPPIKPAPQDVREVSPLRDIAVPFNFAETKGVDINAAGTASPDDELADRMRTREEVRWLFIAGNFEPDKIEALFSRYREDKSKTASGYPKLDSAYDSLATLYDGRVDSSSPAAPAWHKDVLAEWKTRYPNSPTPYIFEATIALYRATSVLNDQLARSTYPGGMAALKAQVEEAGKLLEANKNIASTDPRYYALMVKIMRNNSAPIDEILHVAFEGADRHPFYLTPYFEAINAIAQLSRSPLDDIEALANTAVEKSRQVLGDEAYARVHWYAIRVVLGIQSIPDLKWNWARMKSSMETLLARYPAQWNIQNFATFACFAQDQTTTRTLIDQVKGRPIPELWYQSEIFDACRQFANTPPAVATRKTRLKAR